MTVVYSYLYVYILGSYIWLQGAAIGETKCSTASGTVVVVLLLASVEESSNLMGKWLTTCSGSSHIVTVTVSTHLLCLCHHSIAYSIPFADMQTNYKMFRKVTIVSHVTNVGIAMYTCVCLSLHKGGLLYSQLVQCSLSI